MSFQLSVDRQIQIKQNGNWVDGVVSRMTTNKVCVKTDNDDIHSFFWINQSEMWASIRLSEYENEMSEFEFAARAGNKDDADKLSALKVYSFSKVQGFRIDTNLLSSSCKSASAVHIYAKPKGKESKDLGYHHIKSVEIHCDPWSFPLYVVDQEVPFCVDEVVELNRFSESTETGGRIEVVSSSKIIISESGVLSATECGLEKNSKYRNRGKLKFGEYVGELDAVHNVDTQTHVVGSGGGIICLIAVMAVVNGGILTCKGNKGGLFSGGTICIFSDGAVDNQGIIDGGNGSQIIIQCEQFVNGGQIVPAPNLIIGTSKSLTKCMRNKTGLVYLRGNYTRFINYYHGGCKMLKFSEEFKSSRLILEDDSMWVMRNGTSNGHGYVLTTEDPVIEGIHCLRIQVFSYILFYAAPSSILPFVSLAH